MRRSARCLALGIAMAHAATMAAVTGANAQAPDFYAGKTVSMLIGFGPGGGNDIWARIVARHLGKHIPGNPTIVPQNLPGGGGLLVANQVYNVSPKDGTVIALINRGIPLEPLLGGQGAKFDSLKFNYLGSPDQDTAICAARKDSGVTTLKTLYEKDLVMGATGSGADSAVYPEFLSLLLGMRFKVVKGYKGSNDIRLAIERGEVQGICGSSDSVMNSDLGRSGKLAILFQARLTPDPRLKDIPLGTAGARTEDERKILELFFLRATLGRPFIAPPDVPAERVAILRRAFENAMKDEALIEEAAKLKFTVEPMSGDELADRVSRAFKMPADIVRKTTEVLGRMQGPEKKKQ